jgi:hypothetical protein
VQSILMILPVLGATAGMFLALRFLRGSDRNVVAIGCGVLAVASSAYSLLTTSSKTPSYWVHLGVLLLATVGVVIRTLRTRRS